MKNNLPGCILELDSVYFENQEDAHMVPKFKLEKLGELKLNNFKYESKATADD